MANQKSYTTVKVSRFGFSVLSVTLDRVNTEDVKAVACSLISSVTKADEIDSALIEERWNESLNVLDKFWSFNVEAGGDYRDDYHVSIQHFELTDQQRIDAVRAAEPITHMV